MCDIILCIRLFISMMHLAGARCHRGTICLYFLVWRNRAPTADAQASFWRLYRKHWKKQVSPRRSSTIRMVAPRSTSAVHSAGSCSQTAVPPLRSSPRPIPWRSAYCRQQTNTASLSPMIFPCSALTTSFIPHCQRSSISTVDQRKQLLAEATVDLLTRIIDSDEQDEFTHRMIRPTLVSRSSCRASKKINPQHCAPTAFLS